MSTRTTTRIELVIDVPGSSYGPEWNLGDVIAQARKEAPASVQRLLPPSFKVIGAPKVSVITVVDDDAS